MTISVLGTGNVGRVLGRRFAERGHLVVYGTRDPRAPKVIALLRDHPGSPAAALIGNAVRSAEIVVLAVPFGVVPQVLSEAGDLSGKILIDATNPILPKLAGLSVGRDSSGAEQIAALGSGARVVKAFNTVGVGVMAQPEVAGHPAFLPVASDDPEARGAVAALARDLGFDAVELGPLANARYTEPLAMIWISMAYQLGHGPDFAFALQRRHARMRPPLDSE